MAKRPPSSLRMKKIQFASKIEMSVHAGRVKEVLTDVRAHISKGLFISAYEMEVVHKITYSSYVLPRTHTAEDIFRSPENIINILLPG